MTQAISRGLQTNHLRPTKTCVQYTTLRNHQFTTLPHTRSFLTVCPQREACVPLTLSFANAYNIPQKPCASPAHPASLPGSSFKPLSQPPLSATLHCLFTLDSFNLDYRMSNLPSRTATPIRDTGSHTIEETRPNPVLRLSAPSGVLRLRAEPEERRHIQWAEDVIDNEGMGKKSSKGMFALYVLGNEVESYAAVSREMALGNGCSVERKKKLSYGG